MWSKVEQILRGIKARIAEELLVATATALNSVMAADMLRVASIHMDIQHFKIKKTYNF